MKKVVTPATSDLKEQKVQINKDNVDEAEELTGKLTQQREQDKLMNSVMDADEETIDDGKMLNDAINSNQGAFTPDLMFDKLVDNYSLTKHIHGEKIIRALSGYDPNYIEKNINIPEFQRDLKQKIAERVESTKKKKLIDHHGHITDKGFELASLVMYTEEIDKLNAKGLIGEKEHKKVNIYGEKQLARNYKKDDRYKDIAVRKSIKTAIRRGHNSVNMNDLKSFDRKSKGRINIIYALDSSGSMKGNKIEACKKAGVALAFKAIEEKDKVGLVVFGKEVETKVEPTGDFPRLLSHMTKITASNETDLANTIKEAIELFPNDDSSKHLILLTDAVPTAGSNPVKETLEAVGIAAANGITISLIGIDLDDKGEELANQIVEIGDGKLYTARETDDIDMIVLEDYYRM